jgi:murein DD-endopeptidase MepM/ murein hydrolase activator NlpD
MCLVTFKDTLTPIKHKLGDISSTYGSIDPSHKTPHSGLDFIAPIGTKLYAPVEGVVSKVYNDETRAIGKAVFVRTEHGYQYILGHLSEVKVKTGEVVHVGDLLALSGNSGTHTTGAHVHFGVIDSKGHFVDPDKFMRMFADKVKDAFVYLVDSVSDQAIDLVQLFIQIPVAI